jgi:kynurenine 3-monooxygenase
MRTGDLKEISILGAGLVGSLLSLYLARKGYQVKVYERRADMRQSENYGGRSINLALSNRGLRALEEVGLSERLTPLTIPMRGRMVHALDGSTNLQPYGRDGQFINSISRGELNKALMNAAEHEGVTFYFENRCLEVDIENTTLELEDPKGLKTLNTDLIIGADGAFSAVRMALQKTDRFDYAQHYLAHGYKELTIPPTASGDFAMDPHALHIWPRGGYMLIALPNPDKSFTCTLFFPFEGEVSFAALQTDAEVDSFFENTFPDAKALMPRLVKDFRQNPTSSLVTVRCFPWAKNRTLLIGDAAHAIVPFYGQGMNAGFEDCRVFGQLLDTYGGNWDQLLPAYQELRKPDADAIADLALQNFIEMRDLVADNRFVLRKKIEARLHATYPHRWIPLYSMVTFHEDMRYSEALQKGKIQDTIMQEVMNRPGIESQWETMDLEPIVKKLEEMNG